MYRTLVAIGGCAWLFGLPGCSDDSARPPQTAAETAKSTPAQPAALKDPKTAASEQDLVKRGRAVYLSNCIACHNPDPSQDGAIGPANAGSSEALLEAKVIHNTYPPGYTPKRDSNAMIPLPHLEKDIPALHAYLSSGTP